jgi:hypothetical protein
MLESYQQDVSLLRPLAVILVRHCACAAAAAYVARGIACPLTMPKQMMDGSKSFSQARKGWRRMQSQGLDDKEALPCSWHTMCRCPGPSSPQCLPCWQQGVGRTEQINIESADHRTTTLGVTDCHLECNRRRQQRNVLRHLRRHRMPPGSDKGSRPARRWQDGRVQRSAIVQHTPSATTAALVQWHLTLKKSAENELLFI